MGLLKGEEIVHKKIRMPGHIPKAIKILEKIGSFEEDVLEFIDLTENDLEAKKSFFPLIRRCENMEIKLNALEKFADEFNIPIENFKNYSEFKQALYQDQQKRQIKDNTYFDYVESEIIDENKTISDLYESYNKIKENLMIEIQRKITLEKYFSLTAATIIDQNNPKKSSGRKRSLNRNNIINNEENDFGNYINNNLNQSGISNASVDSIIRENQYEPITGLCYAYDELRMKRMIFRVSRDKVLCTFFDAEFPEEFKPKEEMKIFVMFCPKVDYLIAKMLKICDIYNCPRFDIPDNYVGHVMEILPDISEKILEHKNYLFEAKKTLKSHLEDYILIKKKLQLYKIYFKKEKLIFLNISRCNCGDNFIDGEVWVLKKNFEKLKKELNLGDDEESSATFIDVKDYGMDRPTYISVNDLTYPFQEIVNQYGIPNYHEINPGFFTIVTFPFLFGIMFGDMGHGLILFLISIYLFYLANKGRRDSNIINNEQMPQNNLEQNILDSKEDSMLKSCVQFRYFFLICSIFAIFCGLMYNEFFSIPLDFFGTCYNNVKDGKLVLDKEIISKNNIKKCVYPIGLDPSWIGKQNELAYTNSLKMKLSIIVGVIHMLLGIGIKGVNFVNSRKYNAFIFEFIPQFFFMFILFGYLIYMIFYKWGTDYDEHTDKAPSILTIMINMAVKFGSVEGNPLFNSLFGLSQETINILVIFICLLLIPLMLFVKPIYSYLKKKQTQGIKFRNDDDMSLIKNENKNDDNLNINNNNNDNINNNLIIDDIENDNLNINNEQNLNKSEDYSLSLSQESILRPDEHYSKLYYNQKKKYKEEAREKYKFVEIFIGQLIDVIEYVLGTVSNTASYLRLWALSLAHTALSHVFIEKTFIEYVQKDEVNFVSSIISVFIYFFVFLCATVFILIFMDAMECILHTLRLHWVEFQNKFYKGNGYLFNPFSFKSIFNSNA